MVIAVGTCASSGGVFHNCYNVLGGVDKVIPVDVWSRTGLRRTPGRELSKQLLWRSRSLPDSVIWAAMSPHCKNRTRGDEPAMENIKQIDKNSILSEGKKLLDAGGKFVSAVCNDLDPELEVTYFFSSNRGINMTGLRYSVAKG